MNKNKVLPETKNNDKIVTVYHYGCKFKFTNDELEELNNHRLFTELYPLGPIKKNDRNNIFHTNS